MIHLFRKVSWVYHEASASIQVILQQNLDVLLDLETQPNSPKS